MLSALTPCFTWRGQCHHSRSTDRDDACGSEYSPEPTPALSVPAPFQDDLDASRFFVADAVRRFPSVMFPRFGPIGGLAMNQPATMMTSPMSFASSGARLHSRGTGRRDQSAADDNSSVRPAALLWASLMNARSGGSAPR